MIGDDQKADVATGLVHGPGDLGLALLRAGEIGGEVDDGHMPQSHVDALLWKAKRKVVGLSGESGLLRASPSSGVFRQPEGLTGATEQNLCHSTNPPQIKKLQSAPEKTWIK